MQLKSELNENGFIVLKNFFDKDRIENIRTKAESIFKIQFDKFGYNGTYKENMIQLFNEKNILNIKEIDNDRKVLYLILLKYK
jgi:ectoine hydroxylase-related dioxygenase (phytanoyl-CoA dioxygenase family)